MSGPDNSYVEKLEFRLCGRLDPRLCLQPANEMFDMRFAELAGG